MKTLRKHDYEEWDPFSLLGSVEIVDEQGRSIQDDCSYLDDWLIALAKGLLAIRSGDVSATTEVITEPWPLECSAEGRNVILKWRDQRIVIDDISNACDNLSEKLFELVSDLASSDEPRDEDGIRELEDFANRLAEGPVGQNGSLEIR